MAENLTPEQRAELAWSEGWGCSRDLQVRCIADAIRSALEAERERCALIADDMASVCAYSRDLNPTIWDRCRNVSLDIADAIRSPSQEAANNG